MVGDLAWVCGFVVGGGEDTDFGVWFCGAGGGEHCTY